MLPIKIKETELFDEKNSSFIKIKEQVLHLEHSLISLQKWESKWKKPFLSTMKNRTEEEALDYIKCMTINPNVIDENVYKALTANDLKEISRYINDPFTATTFSDGGQNPSEKKEIITAEIIYYDMIAMNIPQEYRKWHLNQLLTLIQVCSIKSQTPKKMSKNQIARENAARNAARRKALNSKG